MNENKDFEFDQILIEQLSEMTPSEEEISNTNPWSKPIGYITWGFILTTLHLNFLYLQYILPTIGVLLLFLGFRSLQNENKCFKAAWIFSIIKLFLHLIDIVRSTTPLVNTDYPIVIGAVFVAFQIAMFLVFRNALRAVFHKAGKEPERDPLVWASVWTVIVFLLAVSPFANSWLAFIPTVICYILIVRSLYCIGRNMDDTGYCFTNAPVKISNRVVSYIYVILAVTIVIVCCISSNHLRLDAQEYQQPEMTQTRELLRNMGLPEEILQYLADEDIAPLADAINVETFTGILMFNKKDAETKVSENHYVVTSEAGKKNMEATTVYFEMPNSELYVLHYFRWTGDSAYWQDGIQIWADTNAVNLQLISSGLLYDRDDVTYTAAFPRLVCDTVTASGFFGSSQSKQIVGAVSYPFGSENQRGYVLSRYTMPYGTLATCACLNYTHLSHPFCIPYAGTDDKMLSGAYFFSNTTQQHYTNYMPVTYQALDQ